MTSRAVLLLATMVLTIVLASGVARAIINGGPDRGPNAHPYVGAYVAKVEGDLLPVCSGTLISPTVFLTAGHCTEFWKEEGLPKEPPTYVTSDPTFEPGSSEVIKGTPYTHPKYCPLRLKRKVPCVPGLPPDFSAYDVGVVVLDEPVRMVTYGALPDVSLADTLEKGQPFTAVGYGLRKFDPFGGERYKATLRQLNTNDPVGDTFIKTTGFRGIGQGGEGACSGDSGGPLFLPDQETIVGVASFTDINPITGLCREPLYNQRVDLPQVLNWIRSF